MGRKKSTVDEGDIADLRQELVDWKELFGTPENLTPEYLGPLVNCLWRLDVALNPARLLFGESKREDPLQGCSPAVHLARRDADRLIVMFGVEHAIAGDVIEDTIAQAAEAVVPFSATEEPEILPHLYLNELPTNVGRATAMRRNVLFAIWRARESLSYGEIRDRWNGFEESMRQEVSPRNSARVAGNDLVKKCVKEGRKYLESTG